MNQTLENILNIFKSLENFILITHLNPDIDGISSMLALHIFLKTNKKNSFPILEIIPENINFLPYSEDLILIDNFNLNFEKFATIVLDTHTPERIFEKIYLKIASSEIFIIIDHHHVEKNRIRFSENEITLIDSSAPSTTYLIYEILRDGNFIITPEMAQNLLSGLYFDTGSFKYENVNEKTFLVAGELCKLGANPHLIASHLFENISVKEIEILKKILDRLEFLENGIIAISYLTFEDIKEIGIKNLNDFSNFLRSIKEVKISVLIKEVEKNIVSVSLRSRAPIEILHLAKTFGGGGHKYACGFKMKVNNFYEFLENFKEILRDYYGS